MFDVMVLGIKEILEEVCVRTGCGSRLKTNIWKETFSIWLIRVVVVPLDGNLFI